MSVAVLEAGYALGMTQNNSSGRRYLRGEQRDEDDLGVRSDGVPTRLDSGLDTPVRRHWLDEGLRILLVVLGFPRRFLNTWSFRFSHDCSRLQKVHQDLIDRARPPTTEPTRQEPSDIYDLSPHGEQSPPRAILCRIFCRRTAASLIHDSARPMAKAIACELTVTFCGYWLRSLSTVVIHP